MTAGKSRGDGSKRNTAKTTSIFWLTHPTRKSFTEYPTLTKNLRRNKGMLPAGKSAGEELIYRKIREKLGNIEIIRRSRNLIINPKTGYGFELDLYLPKLNLAFEVDGQTHRTNCYGEERLKYQQRNDSLKDRLCQEAGIKLVRIPYGRDIGIMGELARLRFKDLIYFLSFL